MTKCSKYLTFILFALSGFWAACTQERSPCLIPKIASLKLETMHLVQPADTSFADTGLPAAIFIPLAKVDSNVGTLYPKQSVFTISLSPDSTVCSWLFTPDSLYAYDTLTFYYRRNRTFLSNSCGFTYFYTLDSVLTTRHNIDSVHITNTSVTNNVNTNHLQVFIRDF